MMNKLNTSNMKKVMVLNNFVDQVAARPPSQHSDDSELYQVDYCLLMNEGVFLFETPKDVYLHVFAEPLTTGCLALLIAAAILAEAAFLHIFTPLASQPNII